MVRIHPRHSKRSLRLEKGFFYSFNVQGQGRCAASSRSVPCTAGLGVAAIPTTGPLSHYLRFELKTRFHGHWGQEQTKFGYQPFGHRA